MRALVYGLAVTGVSTVRALRRRDVEVVAADDRTGPDADRLRVTADGLGIELVSAPGDPEALVAAVDLVVPSPGVPEWHPVVEAARRQGVPLASEIELAHRWEQERPGGPRPMIAVTGTDGKTTTTLLVAAMLTAAGHRTVAAGNTEVPLVDAIETQVDAFVVECTSFRLAWTERFRAEAAIWLNLAEDHLDWHRSMATYEAAKARIFELQRADDVAIGFAEDPVVVRHLATAPARRRSFARADADYSVRDGWLSGPDGPIAPLAAMRRALPHDVTNALAGAAAVLETGLATRHDVADALERFTGPPHRITEVAVVDGVRYVDDSKATTPHAAAVAVRSFDPVVLIAGGHNKGLDLAPLAAHRDRIRAVVAIGDAAPAVAEVFDGVRPVVLACSMADAVEQAARVARPGDTVLLSPGCASWDWYPVGGYAARGDAFAAAVHERVRPGSEREETS